MRLVGLSSAEREGEVGKEGEKKRKKGGEDTDGEGDRTIRTDRQTSRQSDGWTDGGPNGRTNGQAAGRRQITGM